MHQEFDLDPTLLYLNSGSHSICPRKIQEAVINYQRSYELNPTFALFHAWPKLWKVQEELASFFHASPKDIFFRSNVTAVLNAFILGIPLSSGSEILTNDLEYGAIQNVCTFRTERDKLKLRNFSLPMSPKEISELTPEKLADLVISQLRPETKMLVLSHVITGTGLVLPIAEIAKHTREAGVYLVVDGAHAPGAIPVDFRNLQDVDFYAGNLHKWMMGPKGTAFGWVALRHQNTLNPISAGWTTFETVEYFSGFGDGSRFQGRFLMNGCHDFAPFFALHETLEFWNRHTPNAIFGRIYELQNHLEQQIDAELKWTPLSPPFGSLRGPLLTYEVPEKLQPKGAPLMFQIFKEHRLQIAVFAIRDKLGMRFSPHIHNRKEELNKAVQILQQL